MIYNYTYTYVCKYVLYIFIIFIIETFMCNIHFQGGRKRGSDSLDIGYGKCPEFVVVDGLIVSRESGDSNEWREEVSIIIL